MQGLVRQKVPLCVLTRSSAGLNADWRAEKDKKHAMFPGPPHTQSRRNPCLSRLSSSNQDKTCANDLIEAFFEFKIQPVTSASFGTPGLKGF
ncbi:hypothetical protein E4U21_001300 [Claviceps maximensis]|nr:hypothetical protein E4U21_001300 [Claviceps maximensis]